MLPSNIKWVHTLCFYIVFVCIKNLGMLFLIYNLGIKCALQGGLCVHLDVKLSAAARGIVGRSTISDHDDSMMPSSIFTRIRSSVSYIHR